MASGPKFDDQQYNPFAAPASLDHARDGMGSDAERIRRELIGHEASIQSIGLLYLLGSFLVTIAGIGMAAVASGQIGRDPEAESVILIGGLLVLVGLGQGVVGFGLRRLRPWTKIPVGVISGIGLLGIPLGTIINGYILYLMFSEKGTRVLSPDYQEIIRETPHIKYQTSIIVKILLVLLLCIIGLALLAVFLGG
jgi:hypothetical protein